MQKEIKVGFIDGGLSKVPTPISDTLATSFKLGGNVNVVSTGDTNKPKYDKFYMQNSYPKNVVNTKGGV